MLRKILSISGRSGLYRLVSQGKNMLIVENIADGKRFPAYARDKVISLGDVSIYTTDEDVPLTDVLETIKEKNDGKPVDIKSFKSDGELRKYFATILPDFDDDRVYTTDIRKVFAWYNMLIAAGVDQFKDVETAQEQAAESTEPADGVKEAPKAEK